MIVADSLICQGICMTVLHIDINDALYCTHPKLVVTRKSIYKLKTIILNIENTT